MSEVRNAPINASTDGQKASATRFRRGAADPKVDYRAPERPAAMQRRQSALDGLRATLPAGRVTVVQHEQRALEERKGREGDIADAQVRVLRSEPAILEMEPVLANFAQLCEQAGALSDLKYFLGKPGHFDRGPVLMLLLRSSLERKQKPKSNDLLGVMLLFEYRALGVRTGVYTSNDRSGASTLVAPSEWRDQVAEKLSGSLLKGGAKFLLFSYRSKARQIEEGMQVSRTNGVLAARRSRRFPDYLVLAPTFEATLAAIGQRTRSNMRYYRRRAEKDLGCTFVPNAAVSREELRSFNKACMYAVSDRLSQWRVSTLRSLHDPILAGIKDAKGNWISLLGGRRQGTHTEVLWQMNRNNLQEYSVSLVLRSYLIEHEIERGATHFSIEGGTPHPISKSFHHGLVMDVLKARDTLRGRFMLRLAGSIRGVSNELITMLAEPALKTAVKG